RVSGVIVDRHAVRAIGDERGTPAELRVGEWTGFRSRFWTVLVRPDATAALQRPSAFTIDLRPSDGAEALAWRYTVYSGPVQHAALPRVDPQLGRLLFSGLLFCLRPLSFGLLWLFRALTELMGHPGPAIIGLAVSVKVVLLPLPAVAERLQRRVNATQ